VSADFWPVITVGIVILIAIATSNRSLRRELGERIDGMGKRVDGLSERIDGVRRELGERIDGVQRELGERIDGVQRELGQRIDGLGKRIDGVQRELADVRERLGRVEGLLEGFGLTRRKGAHEAHGNDKQ